MQTLEPTFERRVVLLCLRWCRRFGPLFWPVMVFALLSGCSKDPAMQAVESDANGYFCRSCKARMYSDRKVFLENCPKCKENALVDVIGYWCEKDKHLTIRQKIAGPEGASVCEKCNQPLRNAMVSPREKDLLAWGATETQPK